MRRRRGREQKIPTFCRHHMNMSSSAVPVPAAIRYRPLSRPAFQAWNRQRGNSGSSRSRRKNRVPILQVGKNNKLSVVVELMSAHFIL